MVKKKTSLGWKGLKVIFAFLLLGLVFSKTDLGQLKTLYKQVQFLWIFATFLFFVLMAVLKTYQYYFLLSGKIKYRDVLNIVVMQNAISNFVATSAGILSYMVMLKSERGVTLTRSGIIFIITKFGDLLAICFYLSLSSILVWNFIFPLHHVTVFFVLGILLALVIFLLAVWRRQYFIDWIEDLTRLPLLRRLSFVSRGIDVLRSLAAVEATSLFSMLRTGAVISFLYMSATMAFVYSSMQAFNVRITLWALIYVAAIIQLVSFVPIQVFGGLGVSEITFV
jgi:hypothetical protein